ncbi:MAG: diacylglycerol kinase [Geobacteraceae bacterium]|nr:diacylglycerol kinase [Geobacteraceae bacterium]
MKPTRFIDSLNCAIDGVLYAARTQKHLRNHFLAAAVVLLCALFLKVTAVEFILLAISISFVLFAELINTAVEVTIDLITIEFHPMAKIAKDVAAGSVLLSVTGALVTGYLILSSYIFPIYKELLAVIGTPLEMAALVSLLVVIIAIILLKALSGQGRPFHGGLVSGHAAIAFSIATLVTLSTQDPIISLLTIALAVMVSHSRLLMHIHTLKEIVFGALTGLGITVLVTILFRWLS